jgi:hydroxybutyrate-dimer hydrolase
MHRAGTGPQRPPFIRSTPEENIMESRSGHAAARAASALIVSAGLLSACGGGNAVVAAAAPASVTPTTVTVYPATTPGSGSTAATQDLLTGGLGKTGLGAAAAPVYADPLNPTAAELRRNALYSN